MSETLIESEGLCLQENTGWHWMMERWEVLRQAQWPQLDAAGLMTLARWVAVLLLAFGAAHLLAKWAGQKFSQRVELPETRMEQTSRAAS